MRNPTNKVLLLSLATLCLLFGCSHQNFPLDRPQPTAKLEIGKPISISLLPKQDVILEINTNTGPIYELAWLIPDEKSIAISIIDPNGFEIVSEREFQANAYQFVPQKNGKHLVKITLENSDGPPVYLSIQLDNNYKLPDNIKVTHTENIAGYKVQLLESKADDISRESFATVSKDGVLKYFLHKTDYAFFPFDSEEEDGRLAPSARLYRNTPDKTGDGTPDTIINIFSMGAHCCSEYRFIELGDIVWQRKNLYTGNAGLSASRVNRGGGLIYATNDDNFAYWLTSFAGSPMPDVSLSFRNGQLLPDIEAMRKPPPNLKEIDSEAREARSKIDRSPYLGAENPNTQPFDDAFWGRMLDLIYSGHTNIAWQYFDIAWPPEKSGKDLFRNDFVEQLNKSDYYKSLKQ